jgi:hypothetical protein
LVDSGRYYFLSRPRRFGKSLFIDTLKQAFLGNKVYFKGLYLETRWDWQTHFPVIHISFGGGVIEERHSLDIKIAEMLKHHANQHQIQFEFSTISGQFEELIQKLHHKYQQKVVILIDEYDKPILDNLTNTPVALQIREGLKNLYSVIKDCDEWLKFVFLTGVSKFSKVSLFSGLNNLEDICLIPDYALICGYTESDLKAVFGDKLAGVDLELLKRWYDGYHFWGESIYNPYDILLYLKHKVLKNYWFETATPSFLLKLIQQKEYYLPQLEQLEVTEEILDSFDVEYLSLETLLFQTGYLTIKKVDHFLEERIFTLGYPNLEVKKSLNNYLLNYLIHDPAPKTRNMRAIYQALKNNELDSLKDIFQALFASIPYNWYTKNPMNEYEGYYASIFYCYLNAFGLDLIGEDATYKGRIDLTVKLDNKIFIIEFKLVDKTQDKDNKKEGGKKTNTALQQIKNKRYYEKYLSTTTLTTFPPTPKGEFKTEIYLIGVEFNPQERNIENFDWENLD